MLVEIETAYGLKQEINTSLVCVLIRREGNDWRNNNKLYPDWDTLSIVFCGSPLASDFTFYTTAEMDVAYNEIKKHIK